MIRRKDNKIKNLEYELQDFSILDRYVKNKNETLRKKGKKIQRDNKKLASQNRKLHRLVRKWFHKSKELVINNKTLKNRLVAKRDKERCNLDIIIDVVRSLSYYKHRFGDKWSP